MSAPEEDDHGWKDFLSALPWLLPAVVVRVWVQLTGRCILDSDEGIIGIQMLEALRGEFRAFFHGQDYLGTLPWVLGAPGLLVFGASPNGLRFIYIIYVMVILLLWRGILGRLGAKDAWPWFAIILGIAPAFMTEYTLRARGTVEGMLAGSVWLWVVVWILADTRSFDSLRRWVFGLGVVTGLAWWTTQLSIFFFIPGAIVFFGDRRVSGEMQRLLVHPWSLLWIASVVMTAVVFLRASLPYQSLLQAMMWQMRPWLLGVWVVLLVSLLMVAWRTSLPRWSALGLVGLVLGYLPALCVVWSKEEIYNTTTLQPLHSWFGNALTFLMMGSLDLLGIGSERSEWNAAWAAAGIFAAGLLITSVVLLALGIVKSVRQRSSPMRLEVLLFCGCAWSVFFYFLAAPASVPLGHYGAFTGFFLFLSVAVFFWRLSMIHHWAAVVVAAVLVAIHGVSVWQMPRMPIDWRTGVEHDDSEVIRFLLERDITIAATSLSGSSMGYWEAYRLTFSSGERLRVHPILHMPRVDRYRITLREAGRTALVTTTTEMIVPFFEEAGIEYEETRIGRLIVIHGFDKGEVDRLGLIDYRRRLDE